MAAPHGRTTHKKIVDCDIYFVALQRTERSEASRNEEFFFFVEIDRVAYAGRAGGPAGY